MTTTTAPSEWNRSRKIAIILGIFLGPWAWLYTYRRDAWKAAVGIAIHLNTLTSGVYLWLFVREGFFSEIAPPADVDLVMRLLFAFFLVILLAIWLGIWVWAIVDMARAREWHFTEPRRRTKWVAVLLAVFLGEWTWLYTYRRDAWKFWVGTGVNGAYYLAYFLLWRDIYFSPAASPPAAILLIALLPLAVWIYAIVDAAKASREWYESLPW